VSLEVATTLLNSASERSEEAIARSTEGRARRIHLVSFLSYSPKSRKGYQRRDRFEGRKR